MLKGKITISTPSGTDHGKRIDYVQITLEDELSHTRFLRIAMNYGDLARAITGHGMIPCEFELHADKVGLVHEHKREKVFIPNGAIGAGSTQKERATWAVQALETDGWMGRVRDALNHRRVSKREDHGCWRSVSFDRYVEKKGA